MNDPTTWRLSPCQTEVMDAIVEHGCAVVAAKELGTAVSTVRTHIMAARLKIGAGNIVLAAVAWDRYSRKPAKETP